MSIALDPSKLIVIELIGRAPGSSHRAGGVSDFPVLGLLGPTAIMYPSMARDRMSYRSPS